VPYNGRRKRFCLACGGHVSEVGTLSARGKCWTCGGSRVLANADDLRRHSGPYFDHWRRRSLAALGVIVVDAPPPEA
jgi:hypothetical protein